MKLKYYLNNRIIALIFLSFIILILVIQHVDATSVTSATVLKDKMFKCEPNTLTVVFSDDVITSLTAKLSGQEIMEHGLVISPEDSVTMTKIANGQWQGTYGNDATLKWGTKTITYIDNGSNTYAGGSLFVYGDICTGTGVTKYTQVSSGMGRYTKLLYQENFSFIGTSMEGSFIGWALFPWIEIMGYLIYVLVVFVVCSTIYLKTQNVTQPLIIGVMMLLVFASTSFIDPIYRKWILIVLALGITAMYYRVFVKE